MSDLVDQVRLAIIEVWQQSNATVGTRIDSEKMARAAIRVIGERLSACQNSSLGLAGDELLSGLRERA